MRSARIGRAVAAAVLVAALGAAPDARATTPDPDPWFGYDKLLHFGGSASVAAASYAVGASLLDARGHALVLGGAITFGLGITKEVLDLTGLGDPSWRDLTWDAIGTASGLAVAWSFDLLVRGVSPEHPLLVAPRLNRDSAGLQLFVTF